VSQDYHSFSADELLAALEGAGRTPDLDLIRACLERREDLTPALLAMLAEGSDLAWDVEDPRRYRDIHAGLLLCAFREPAALPIFGQVFRDEALDSMLEWFDQDLPAAYGPAAVPMLLDLMNDTDAYDYPRYSAMGMLTIIAQNHPEERGRIVEALRAMLPPLAADGTLLPDTAYSELYTWAAHSLAHLQDHASQPYVLALYRANMIVELILGDEKEYLAFFEQSRHESHTCDILKTYKWLHAQAAQEAQQKAEAAQRAAEAEEQARRRAQQAAAEAEERARRQAKRAASTPGPAVYPPSPPPQTLVRTQPKVGRNAPCPCGSGKKYKYCCGKRQ
jgi:hypothetical protein